MLWKSLFSCFKRPKAASVTQPPPSNHPSTSGPSLAPGLGPISGPSPLGTQSTPATPAVSSVATLNEHLTAHVSTSPIPPPIEELPGLASPPRLFENAQNFVLNNPTMIAEMKIFNSGGGAAMQLLESKTIRGAEHDSSARYPPPKCHPGTRESLKREIFSWAANSQRSWRMFYVLGPAGVGKSAVAQTVADEIDCLGASCFISRPNRRNDPDGVIPTLAHQLAVKHPAYKRIITEKLVDDSTILGKTRRVQFKELLIDPFRTIMTQDVAVVRKPILIIIDGLDECENQRAQCEFIELIGNHVRSFPDFPLLWLICSRPESHLKYALSRPDFQVTCRREEISVDDEEGRQDVLLYLRGEFRDIQSRHQDSLDSDWPLESHLLQIATAASGLFAFASTVARFVGDAETGDPSRQLRVCMNALKSSRAPSGQNPYLTLDLLYQYILSSVNPVTRPTTMRILGMSILYPDGGPCQSVQALANFLCIGKAAFYHALKPLHSVLRIPSSSDAFTNSIEFYHTSFADFFRDPERSGEFCLDEAVHYDIALMALRWHAGVERELQEDDIWLSPSGNAQTCLKSTKSDSLTVLWEACSRVKGENAVRLYQELQNFDFNVLDRLIPTEWRIEDFLSWLNVFDANSSTQKLLNSLDSYFDCNQVNISQVYIPEARFPDFVTLSLGDVTRVHLDIGRGGKCRHIHIDQFMATLVKETIPGAAFDSSARDPPPRCHPGTRVSILERCLFFVANCDGAKKMRWVVGAAGVGKSAVMQSVLESPKLQVGHHASVFFSPNGRDDATKAIVTISYQFAAKSEAYRQAIEKVIARDPSLPRSSMATQFNKLIVEPFIHNPQLQSAGRALVVIDGLDECNNHGTQEELLRLISKLCMIYPASPLVWLIASRPETHITSFFSRRNVMPTYEEEEILVGSDQSRADVELFLRAELTKIKETSNIFNPRWPEEQDIWKLANAAGGLFAYAQTAVSYIGDSRVGSPASQFGDVMRAINNLPMNDLLGHPMILLDALYARILYKVPPKIMVSTRKILLILGSRNWDLAFRRPGAGGNFITLCNWLGMTPDEAYMAINHLRSVLRVPPEEKAHEDLPRAYHQSFIHYIYDHTRSQFSCNIQEEARQLGVQCALRILKEAPDDIDLGDLEYGFAYGILARGSGTGSKMLLTWPAAKVSGWNDNQTRLRMYQLAIGSVATGIRLRDPDFEKEFFVRHLITRFQAFNNNIPYNQLCNCVFDEPLRPAFLADGLLKQIPLEVISVLESDHFPDVKLHFHRPATLITKLSDPWQSTCEHEREGNWEKGKDESWMTVFDRRNCESCFERFKCQVENLKIRSPDHTVLVLFTSTGSCCVEVRFIDLEDGMSEWAYWFWCEMSLEERRKHGSPV